MEKLQNYSAATSNFQQVINSFIRHLYPSFCLGPRWVRYEIRHLKSFHPLLLLPLPPPDYDFGDLRSNRFSGFLFVCLMGFFLFIFFFACQDFRVVLPPLPLSTDATRLKRVRLNQIKIIFEVFTCSNALNFKCALILLNIRGGVSIQKEKKTLHQGTLKC